MYYLVCTVHNGNWLDQRSGTVWYVPCITVTGWVRGQVLSGMYRTLRQLAGSELKYCLVCIVHNGKWLDQRSGTFPHNYIHVCGVSAGSAVLLYSRQLDGSCTINELFGIHLK